MSQSNIERLLLVEKVFILKSLSLFKDTPEHILAELAPLMQEEEYDQNTLVFQEGDMGDCMYIIHQGEVKIHNGETVFAILKEKEVFGELSLLDAEARSATVTTNSGCILFSINQEPFYELLETRPEIARGFIKILCQRLRAQNEKSVR
jgi:CRP-like cAMP-binding protein